MPTITIHNAETGEIIEREMNATESQQYEKDKLAAEAKAAAEVKAKTDKAALLTKLGITADEAQLLIGGN
jgi:hypothetical protein